MNLALYQLRLTYHNDSRSMRHSYGLRRPNLSFHAFQLARRCFQYGLAPAISYVYRRELSLSATNEHATQEFSALRSSIVQTS